MDARISAVRASPAALWRVIEGIGGETGWYSFPAAWAVRGVLDRLAAASGYGADDVIRVICSSVTRWIFGG